MHPSQPGQTVAKHQKAMKERLQLATTLAVKTANAANITLVALARDDTFEIFTHSNRIQTQEASDVA